MFLIFSLLINDVLFNSSPFIQFHVERNWPKFATRILKTRERAISLVQYQYDLIELIGKDSEKYLGGGENYYNQLNSLIVHNFVDT